MSDHDRPTERRAPRPWGDLVCVWATLMHKLAAIVGAPPEELDGNWLAARDGQAVALTTWRWMWSLPPCSEARKAAFTAGAAAQATERLRKATDVSEDDDRGPCGARPEPSGHRAEQLLRILAWHVDDAKGEAAALRFHKAAAPTIPPHERVYERQPSGLAIVAVHVVATGLPVSAEILARAILADHRAHRPDDRKRINQLIARENITVDEASATARAFEQSFNELCIASLPDGPWVMTSQDVGRFLDLILEERAPAGERPVSWDGITRVHVGGADPC